MRIRDLIVLGGPSCIGKSHVIRAIQRGEVSELSKLGIPPDAVFVEAERFSSLRRELGTVVLHYDISRQTRGGVIRVLPQAVAAADHVVYVTLYALRKERIARCLKKARRLFREAARNPFNYRSWELVARAVKVLCTHMNQSATDAIYERWWTFVRTHPGECWELDTTGKYKLTPRNPSLNS